MNKLQPLIFLIPVIALILVIIFYFILLKKVADKKIFKRFVFITLLLAFIFNFAWEIIQGPFYKDFTYSISHIAFCGLASIADAIMVLLIYFVLAIVYKDPLWIKHINLQRTLILILIGGIGAILSEMRHLSLDNWSYASSMPVLPFVNAGLSPVLQFMLLPVLIFYLSFSQLVNRTNS
jgi:signal transduction histidine kinase